MIDDKTFADTVAIFLNKPFKLGGSGDDGYDCLSFFYFFFKALGYEMPEEYEGINMSNYLQQHGTDPIKAKQFLLGFIESVTDEIEQPQKGDIAIMTLNDDWVYGIFIGRGLLLMIDCRVGIIVAPMKNIKSTKTIFRRIKCHR